MSRYSLWAVAVVILMTIYFLFRYRRTVRRLSTEHFVVVASNEDIQLQNDGTQPWNRHPIMSVPYLQMRPAFQRGLRHHANAAYYELDNHDFDMALKRTFRYDCQVRAGPWAEVETPSVTISKEVRDQYPEVIAYLARKMPKVQVVHDRWVGFRRHMTTSGIYLFELETILYRRGKFQGKHVSFAVMVQMPQKPKEKPIYTVTQTRVEGVVPEDQIGMFPVLARVDGREREPENMPVPADPLISYPGQLLDPATIQIVVEEQKNKIQREVASQLFLI